MDKMGNMGNMGNMGKKRTIGLLGGTFDPIHFGHLRAAIEIFEQLALDEMRLIPCCTPPHREAPIASAKDRLAMVKLAVQETLLSVDDREQHREGPSYTVDTLLSFRAEYPKASLCLVVSAKAFPQLPSWYQWEKLIQLANIIIPTRSDLQIPVTGDMATFLQVHTLKQNEKLSDFTAGKIVKTPITTINISATQIRSLLKSQKTPEFLLPKTVIEYIQNHGLYGYSRSNLSSQSTEVVHL